MKVTNVQTFLVSPGVGKNWLFVKVETDKGIHGWGECYTQADRDRAIEWLGKAIEERNFAIPFLKVDPDFDNVRSDPRFSYLLRKLDLH